MGEGFLQTFESGLWARVWRALLCAKNFTPLQGLLIRICDVTAITDATLHHLWMQKKGFHKAEGLLWTTSVPWVCVENNGQCSKVVLQSFWKPLMLKVYLIIYQHFSDFYCSFICGSVTKSRVANFLINPFWLSNGPHYSSVFWVDAQMAQSFLFSTTLGDKDQMSLLYVSQLKEKAVLSPVCGGH